MRLDWPGSWMAVRSCSLRRSVLPGCHRGDSSDCTGSAAVDGALCPGMVSAPVLLSSCKTVSCGRSGVAASASVPVLLLLLLGRVASEGACSAGAVPKGTPAVSECCPRRTVSKRRLRAISGTRRTCKTPRLASETEKPAHRHRGEAAGMVAALWGSQVELCSAGFGRLARGLHCAWASRALHPGLCKPACKSWVHTR